MINLPLGLTKIRALCIFTFSLVREKNRLGRVSIHSGFLRWIRSSCDGCCSSVRFLIAVQEFGNKRERYISRFPSFLKGDQGGFPPIPSPCRSRFSGDSCLPLLHGSPPRKLQWNGFLHRFVFFNEPTIHISYRFLMSQCVLLKDFWVGLILTQFLRVSPQMASAMGWVRGNPEKHRR